MEVTNSRGDDPVIAVIQKTKIDMLFGPLAFYGQVALHLAPQDASDWCRTAATDCRRLYYNRDFILSLTHKQRIFLFAHETLHCILFHLGRRGNRHPGLWNMANDYLVNYMLVAGKVGEMPTLGLYDPNYTDEMTSEEIYDLLVENNVEVIDTLDVHLDIGDNAQDGNGGGEGEGKGKQNGSGPPTITDQDVEAVREEMRSILVRAAHSVGAGNVPAGIARLIEQLINPKLDWRSLLDAHIRSALKEELSYQKISRRVWGLRRSTGRTYIIPGPAETDTIDICIAIDTSGSVSQDMIRDFVSEIKGIMETFRDFRLRIWSFDAVVHRNSYKEFTAENIEEFDTWMGTRVFGGGGTVFQANFDFMAEAEIDPHRLVIFTDGYPNGDHWGDPRYCDTLFVIHASKQVARRIKAPYGLTTYYDAD